MTIEEKLDKALEALAQIHAVLDDEDQSFMRNYRIKEFIKATLIELTIGTQQATQEKNPVIEETTIRQPDWDLEAYLENNEDIYTLADIATVHATVPGHNDEMDWFWVLELHDGRFILTQASCDYTGWDCQSGGGSLEAENAEAAAKLAPEEDFGRPIRAMLLAQLRGEQPFGVETMSFK